MWARANLHGLGAMGDAALAASCVGAPGDCNPNRMICGGMYFADQQMALSWPGAPMIENVPTVINTSYAQFMPTAMALHPTKGEPPRLGPANLVAPLPTITPLPVDRVSDGVGALCTVNRLVQDSPVFAVGVAALLFFMLRGGKR